MRTTINIDTPILKELKELRSKEKKPLGRLVSDLLAEALANRQTGQSRSRKFRWASQEMKPMIDLSDKEALFSALEESSD